MAVLPFDNLTGDPSQDIVVDGLTEEIITSLSQIPNLFVIARNSTFTYKGKAVKVSQVAEELGVRYVLEGSFRSSGDSSSSARYRSRREPEPRSMSRCPAFRSAPSPSTAQQPPHPPRG